MSAARAPDKSGIRSTSTSGKLKTEIPITYVQTSTIIKSIPKAIRISRMASAEICSIVLVSDIFFLIGLIDNYRVKHRKGRYKEYEHK